MKSKVWSNAFFIIPLALSGYLRLYLHSFFILEVIIFSTMFHLSNQKKYRNTDKIFAYLLIMYNFYSFYLSNFKQPYFYLAVLFVIIGFYFLFKKNRDDYEWHISSAIITLLSIIARI